MMELGVIVVEFRWMSMDVVVVEWDGCKKEEELGMDEWVDGWILKPQKAANNELKKDK